MYEVTQVARGQAMLGLKSEHQSLIFNSLDWEPVKSVKNRCGVMWSFCFVFVIRWAAEFWIR